MLSRQSQGHLEEVHPEGLGHQVSQEEEGVAFHPGHSAEGAGAVAMLAQGEQGPVEEAGVLQV